jgi:hypothetical protein
LPDEAGGDEEGGVEDVDPDEEGAAGESLQAEGPSAAAATRIIISAFFTVASTAEHEQNGCPLWARV